MLTRQSIQIINFPKKTLGLIRKMRNVVKLSLFYYKQKNDLLSQHPNDCRSHTLTEWSFAQRTQPGEPHCSHWTIFSSSPSSNSWCHIWILPQHDSSPFWEHGIVDLMFRENRQGAEVLILGLTRYTVKSHTCKPFPDQPSLKSLHSSFLSTSSYLKHSLGTCPNW